MYKFLSKKFEIEEKRIIELANTHSDFKELFDDYEELNISQREKFNENGELDKLYKELLVKLEEEISSILLKYDKNINS